MLLNEISDAELLRLAADPDYWMQQKFDGNRILLVKNGSLTSYSRTARETSALPQPIVKAAMASPVEFTLDGEIVGDVVFAFDLLSLGTVDLRDDPYSHRLAMLEGLFGLSQSGVLVVTTARTPDGKLELFADVRARGGEGVVVKDANAKYQAGRPNTGGPSLKYKFWSSASVIVASHHPTKASVNMKLYDGTELGSCTVTGERPAVGSIVEVKYLYAHRGGSLSQSVYLGVRNDILPQECTIAQLQFKGEAR